MKILLISNYKPDKQQSMLRYAEMLQRELHDRGHAARIVHPPVVFGGLPLLRGALRKWIGYIDKYLIAPSYLHEQAREVDIVHICDHSNSMYLRCVRDRPTLITCHDLLAIFAAQGVYPDIKVGFTGRVLQRWIAGSLAPAKHVICVSKKTQHDLESLIPGVSPRTRVIHHFLNWDYSPAPYDRVLQVKKKIGLAPDTEYIFHVGGNQWYKNRLGVMKVFAALRKYPRFKNVKLIMAGKPWTPEMRQYCRSAALAGEIIECVEVSNEQLMGLYGGAIALLFPSLEEGFGWPVLEAQACGCPVITSNRAPMTEIAGEAALFIDPSAPEEAAQMIADRMADLSSIQMAGFRNLARFAKAKVVDGYISFYEEVRTASS